MAAALECWSARTSTDDEAVEQVLMRTNNRSEASVSPHFPEPPSSSFPSKETPSPSAMQKRLLKLSRNVSEAIVSFKNSLNLDGNATSPREMGSALHMMNGNALGKGKLPDNAANKKFAWASVVRNLIQLYPGSQLPEKLICNVKKHYDSLPTSYAQSGFDTKEVFLHMKLMEQASLDDQPAILIQELPDDENRGSLFKLTFACNSSLSLPTMSSALDNASICCKKIQIFEKKGCTLGVIVLVGQGEPEKVFKTRIESALRYAMKKPKLATVKLSFGLCGCQEETITCPEICDFGDDLCEPSGRIHLSMPLPTSCYVVHVDEWQTIRCDGEEINKWLLSSENLRFFDQISPHSFKGFYKGRHARIEKLKGCDKGDDFKFNLRKDLLELMTCGHRNIQQFHGVCVDEIHGLCVVTKWIDGGSVNDMIVKSRRFRIKEVVRIALDIAEGIKFMNEHDVAYPDLNTSRILLDRNGNAVLADPGIVTACKTSGETVEYETDGYRWLAPEIIAGDPESVTETWMSNSYSFGMVIWEMVSGEAAYDRYSPVQAAVGIAACGLRPDIPKECPSFLQSLMMRCWSTLPSARPRFHEILSILSNGNH